MADEIPAPWLPVLKDRGLDSYRKLAVRAGLAHETVRKVIRGWKTSPASIQAVADALGVDVETVHGWRGEAVPDRARDYVPPPESIYLTRDEREAVNTLIRLLVAKNVVQPTGLAAVTPIIASPADYDDIIESDLTAAAAAHQPHPTIESIEAEQEGFEEYP